VVAVALITVEVAPLNSTVFAPGVGPNPLPVIETGLPGAPEVGANESITIGDGLVRWMATMFPAASRVNWRTFEAACALESANAAAKQANASALAKLRSIRCQ